MPIIRSPRPKRDFTIIPNGPLNDRRLSWSARGMLAYLLSKPDHWHVSVQALVNETADAAMKSRRDAVYRILGELMGVGYISRMQAKADGGAFAEVDYMVSESAVSPLTGNPDAAPLTGLPLTVEPLTVEPLTVKPTLVSTEEAVRTEEAVITEDGHGGLTGNDADEAFQASWAMYPKRAGGNSKHAALKAWNARIAAGDHAANMLAGVHRYAAFCIATGKVGTEYVKQASTFFGPARHFADAWDIPVTQSRQVQCGRPSTDEQRRAISDANAAAWLAGDALDSTFIDMEH
ncbi:hypothetical protein [Paraburkholderia graminis]|uniref:hypothetical protein n=1 Tax=Paraburkholderia graminis TaxID=60548 RepID=UPI0038BD4638